MKIFKKILLVLSIFCCATGVKASHLMSGEISYEHIGSGNYLVRMALFRDCQGIALSQPTINIASTCTTFTITPSQVSNGLSNSYCNTIISTCNGGFFPGYEYFVFEDTVNLPPCSDWTLSYMECCRNAGPVNVNDPSSSSFRIESKLNNSLAENSSPVFSYQPAMIVTIGAPVCLNNTAYDYDGDSIVYSLVAPLYDVNLPATYLGVYSAIDPFGIASQMSFNAQSGNICKPANTGMVGAYLLAIKAEEYRNGVMVGSVIRDLQINQIFSGNNTQIAIDGVVTDAQNNPVQGIAVELYEYSIAQGVMPLISTDTTDAAGAYAFLNMPRKQYVARAMPVDTAYLPTYYQSTFFWNTSQLIFSFCDTLLNGDITLVSTQNPLGTGVVSGYMNGLNIRTIDVAGPVYIFLLDKNTNTLIAQTTIDAAGYYQFNNIPDGIYRITADITGLNMLSTHFPNVSNGGYYGSFDFIATTDGIYALPMLTTKTNAHTAENFILYPNPGNDFVNIVSNAKSIGTVVLYDIVGTQVLAENFNSNTAKLNLTSLSKGSYIIVFETNNGKQIQKWIKE